MHRIDEAGNAAGHFVRRDVIAGTPPTLFGADWPEAVQEEICAVIEGTGAALSKPTHTQLRTAINKMIADTLASSPHITQLLEGKELHTTLFDTVHYRKPDGASLLRSDYPEAWAAIQTSGQLAADHATWLANPTMWGPGIDGDHFDMKDLRAVFTRIDNDGKGGALGPALGQFKANQNQNHHHIGFAGQAVTNTSTGGYGGDNPITQNTSDQGGNEACPDHTSLRYVIRMK